MNPAIVNMYMCSNCGMKHMQYEWAVRCCICSDCGEVKKHPRQQTKCDPCRDKASAKRERDRISKAKFVAYDGNMVLHNDSDKYFYDEDQIFEFLQYDHESLEELPEYLFVATKVTGFTLDMQEVVQNALENEHHEDAIDEVEMLGSLQNYVNTWCQRQTVTSYSPDMEQKILVTDLVRELKIQFEGDENEG